MKKTLKLIKPVMINNVETTELTYDETLITGEQFLEADARAHSKASVVGSPALTVLETDDSLQYYLGIMAVIAVNPRIDVSDLERITGKDIVALYRIGRNFITGSAGEEEEEEKPDSEENNSEEHSEGMPELFTPVSAH